MRATLVFLVCVLSVPRSVGQSGQTSVPSLAPNPQYFPVGVFDASNRTFKDKWYSGTLNSLQEPSLFALRNDQSLQVYRFLWLPSFSRPISVRLTINADGSGSIVTRSVDRHTGLLTKPASDTGKIILDKTIAIDKADADYVLEHLQRFGFWSMPTEEKLRGLGLDGSQWVLEGIRGGEYHVVDRWSPKDNSYSQLCTHLVRLGKIDATLY